MTRVDRPRADGWPECGTCEGTGKVDSSCSDQCDYEVACPDCVDGRVPLDGMVEAACEASWSAWWEGRRRPWHLEQEPSIKQLWREHIRAALVAAARWEIPGE